MRYFYLVLLGLLFTSCSAVTSQTRYAGPAALKGAPVVYIHPGRNLYHEAVVGILPFHMPLNTVQGEDLRVAALFKDVLLGKQAFKVVRLLDNPYADLESALADGKMAGVDLVLAGSVNYAIAGTEMGGAKVDVSVRMLNTHTGNTVWYMDQTMDQPMDYPDVSVVGRLRESFSPPPIRRNPGGPAVLNMMVQIAADMADVFDGATVVSR